MNKSIEELEKLINETENGIYDYNYAKDLHDNVFKYCIIVNYQTTISELANFLKELEMWRVRNNVKSFQIDIVKGGSNE